MATSNEQRKPAAAAVGEGGRTARGSRGDERTRLSRQDWARAALGVMAAGGVSAVSVEAIASSLGATKGSFYWHFKDRAELIDDALTIWERENTDGVIAQLDALPEPVDRLRALFDLTHHRDDYALEAVMLAESGHPQVGPVLQRVTRRRVGYIAGTLRALGLPARDAHYRALLSFQSWIGFVSLSAAIPDIMPSGADAADYLRHIVTSLELGGPPEPLQ